jgi:hypothetical protein
MKFPYLRPSFPQKKNPITEIINEESFLLWKEGNSEARGLIIERRERSSGSDNYSCILFDLIQANKRFRYLEKENPLRDGFS